MKKTLIFLLALILLGSTGATAVSGATEDEDGNFLKSLGVRDDQLELLGDRTAIAAYAAQTRKLNQDDLQKFLQTYLYVYPSSGSGGGSLIDGLVDFGDGALVHRTAPHGPYDRKPIWYEINGTVVKSDRHSAYNEIPLLDAGKVLAPLGYETKTDADTGAFQGSGPNEKFTVDADGKSMTLNGATITLDQAATIEDDGTVFLPLQAFVELGLRVEWDGYMHNFHIASLPLSVPDDTKRSFNPNAPQVDIYANRDLNVIVNGTRQYLTSIPLNYEGTNYLPVDALAAALDLDAAVDESNEPVVHFWTQREPFPWKPDKPADGAPIEDQPAFPTQAQLVDGASVQILHSPRSSYSHEQGEPLEGRALRYNGILYLPMTEVAEKVGYEASYDADTKTSLFVKPIEQFVQEKLRLGVNRAVIRGMIGNPNRVLLNGRTGNVVWRYDGVNEEGYLPAEEKLGNVLFDKPDVEGLKAGKLNYQLFIQCYKPEQIMTSYTLYYRDADGQVLRYDVNEYGGWSLGKQK